MAKQQKAVILRIEAHVPKTMTRDADAMEQLLASHLSDGWQLAWATPFSGTSTSMSALLVVLERD